jgi:hypothetical protein
MQAVGRRYVAHFNRRYARRGTLWEGRYRATVIEGERFFLLASRVVELAPVRNHLVAAPEDYRWSSYRHHIGLTVDSLITDHPLYWALGNTPFERQRVSRTLRAVARRARNQSADAGDAQGLGARRRHLSRMGGAYGQPARFAVAARSAAQGAQAPGRDACGRCIGCIALGAAGTVAPAAATSAPAASGQAGGRLAAGEHQWS